MARAKTAAGSKASKSAFATKCLTVLRRRAGARNIASGDGKLTSLLLLAIIGHSSPLAQARKALDVIRDSFVDWNELRVTRPAQTVEYLGTVKQAAEKAEAIHDILNNIFEDTHDLDLHFLEGASAEEARDFLTGLGSLDDRMLTEVILAGRGFFHMAADTDVARVARRLEFIGKNTTPGGFQRDIVELVGQDRSYQITYLLKQLAETICKPRAPVCPECPLSKICPGAESKS